MESQPRITGAPRLVRNQKLGRSYKTHFPLIELSQTLPLSAHLEIDNHKIDKDDLENIQKKYSSSVKTKRL